MTALRVRNFRRLWLASMASETGDWMLLISLPVLVFEITGSAAGTSAAFLVELVPGVLVAPLAGRFADRLDRRKLLIAILLVQAAVLLPLLLLSTNLVTIYIVIAAQAGLTAMFSPAKNAMLPTLVPKEKLVSANALIGLNQNLSRLVGASLGGALFVFGGLSVIVTLDMVSFLLAVALIFGVRATSSQATTKEKVSTDRGKPFTRRPVQAAIAIISVTSIGQGLFVVLFVIFVARSLNGDGSETGLLRAVQAVGAIGGGLLLARTSKVRPGKLAGIAGLVFGVTALVTWNLPVVTTALPIYIGLFIAFGVPAVAIGTGLTSALQQATLDGERGLVFAAFNSAFVLGQGLGIIAAGALGDSLGVVPLLNIQAVLYLAAGTVALFLLRDRVAAHGVEPEAEEMTAPIEAK